MAKGTRPSQKKKRELGKCWVYIAEKHDDLVNQLSSKRKAADRSSIYSDMDIGVFDNMRDAYLLAAAIGFAHQTATPVSEMDMGKKPRSIREDHIIGTKDGTGKEKTGTGKRLALLAGLLSHILTPETFDDGDDEEQRLDKQISELASDGDDLPPAPGYRARCGRARSIDRLV